MAQYNLNGFNRAPYNTQPELNVNWLSSIFSEKVTGSTGTAFENYMSSTFNERITAASTVIPARYGTAAASEAVTAAVTVVRVIMMPAASITESVDAVTAASQIVRMTSGLQELITGAVEGARDISLDADLAEAVTAAVAIGKNVHTHSEGFELVSAVSGVEALSEYTGELAITLQPGQRLIIDAGNYNVLLDGVNMIHTYTGDWLDNLNRDTISIQIQAASGGAGLDASILYTERYL